ncbi:MAG: rhodanese-like domain-containing protein [Terracidiphilus sp.]
MTPTYWTVYFVLFGILILFIVMRRAGQISKKAAAEHLRNGALVIDVRTAKEFSGGHLTQAINMPVEEITMVLPNKVKDKNKVLLLHCQSGMRSNKAVKRLAEIGYNNAYNLGSYERAFRIVSGRSL